MRNATKMKKNGPRQAITVARFAEVRQLANRLVFRVFPGEVGDGALVEAGELLQLQRFQLPLPGLDV